MPKIMYIFAVAPSTEKMYDLQIEVSRQEEGGKREVVGDLFFDANEADKAFGTLIEKMMDEDTNVDPVFVLYRDRSRETPAPPEQKRWSKTWGWV